MFLQFQNDQNPRFCFVIVLQYVLPCAVGIFLSGYKSDKNKLLISVDFPSPDSPASK